MRATGVVEVEARGGRTVCRRLRSDPPITLRRTGEGVVHQVGSSAGPIGGDDLVLQVRVGPGASLRLRSVAAALVLPGPTSQPSRVTIEAEVGPDGLLDLALQPQILAHRSDHETTTTIRLAGSATFRLREVTVFGRHGEPGGSLHSRLRVDREDQPVLRSDLALGPRWPDSDGPASIGRARCIGSELWVGPTPAGGAGERPARAGGGARPAAVAVFEIGPGAHLAVSLGDGLAEVAAALDSLRISGASPEPAASGRAEYRAVRAG